MFHNYTFDPKSPTRRHTFEIHGADVATVNAIRRVILADIPVVGFSAEEEPSFEVLANTGPLHNEFMQHRLGLLPLHLTEEETDAYPAEPLTFELNVQNSGDTTVPVTTHDFKVSKNDIPLSDKEVRRIFPIHRVSKSPILITRLRVGEHLHVRGTAVKKTARDHAGFCPVSLCTYHFKQDEAAAAAATSILDKERAYARNEYGEPVAFQFDIETEVGLTPRYLVHKALDILMAKLRNIPEELHNDASTKITYAPAETHGYDFTIQNEDDTVGNLLQTYMHQVYVREGRNAPNGANIRYVGYYTPHPFNRTVVLCVVFEQALDTPNPYIEAISDACRAIHSRLQEMQSAWMAFAPKTNL
jgi:DNA-directed RNA polymerase subunit L